MAKAGGTQLKREASKQKRRMAASQPFFADGMGIGHVGAAPLPAPSFMPCS
jgi:hypothetical protein